LIIFILNRLIYSSHKYLNFTRNEAKGYNHGAAQERESPLYQGLRDPWGRYGKIKEGLGNIH
jgi:hypothetical protein